MHILTKILLLMLTIYMAIFAKSDIVNTMSVVSISTQNIIKLYEKNFKKSTVLQVKELNGYYIVLTSTINFGIEETRKLNLIAKHQIFEYLKKSDKKITSITFNGFQNAVQWKDEDRLYLLSFVKRDKVIPDYTPMKKKEGKSVIDEEIILLKQLRNKDVVIHKQLKNLYFQKGDIVNYNREIDILMYKKFNEI